MSESRGALDGLRVLDLATLAAGPWVATFLAEFGADVIKVEQPSGGDGMRRFGPQKDGVGLMWRSMSRNKRCVTLNFRAPEGQDLLPPRPAPTPGGPARGPRVPRPPRGPGPRAGGAGPAPRARGS